jgi:hypothetical protein
MPRRSKHFLHYDMQRALTMLGHCNTELPTDGACAARNGGYTWSRPLGYEYLSADEACCESYIAVSVVIREHQKKR